MMHGQTKMKFISITLPNWWCTNKQKSSSSVLLYL